MPGEEDHQIDEWKMKSWLKGMDNEPKGGKYTKVSDDQTPHEDDYAPSDNLKGVKAKLSAFTHFGKEEEEEEPAIDPYMIHPPFTSLMRRINKEPQTRFQYMCNKLTIVFTLIAYLMGFFALILYADGVYKHSPTVGYMQTMVPILLHTVGVGMSILLKVYYDLSDSVGHLEYMAIIIRSRLWLFPGVIGSLPVVLRSDLEIQRKKEIQAMAKEKKSTSHRFAMVRYLKRCQFPEFRVLFRSFESLPWSTVPSLPDRSLANAITEIAQEDIMDAFPILDFLRVTSSLPSLGNPLNWLRLSKRLVHFFCCRGGRVMSIPKFPRIVTRAEDIEEDDVCKDSDKAGFERQEAMPWGSLRLTDSGARFNALYRQVTTVACVVFVLSLFGYFSMIFGELAFYSRLDAVFLYRSESDAHTYLHDMGGNITVYDLTEDEIDSWINDYASLHQWSIQARLYLIFLIPLAIQASALLAECVVTPLLVIGTLIAHIENFTLEVDQYMAILAVNHGSLSHAAHQITKNHDFPLEKRKRAKKVAMARDMAFSWRMRNFFEEVKFDSEVINGSVGIMILNFICHLVPLNLFIMDPKSTCVPLWMVLFFVMLTITLYYIISGGINCNNLIDGGIDSLLHSWQLKFMMVGWSGGFLQEHNGDVEVDDEVDVQEIMAFVSKDPNEGNANKELSFDTILAALDTSQRISSITRVLEHYEAEVSTPFSVLGVALTQEIITLVAGFFGGSIAGIVMGIIDDKEFFRYTLTCHGFL